MSRHHRRKSFRSTFAKRLLLESLEPRQLLNADPVLLKDINTDPNSNAIYYQVSDPTTVGSVAYFASTDSANGNELWKTDGTVAGTVLVKDIAAGPDGSYPNQFVPLGSYVFFTAATPQSGTELWRTDGTPNGTQLVLDINPGAASSYPDNFYVADGKLYFQATTEQFGIEGWVTDGTPSGTRMIADLFPGPTGGGASDKIKVGNNLLFNGYTGNFGLQSVNLTTGQIDTSNGPHPQIFGGGIPWVNNTTLFTGFTPELGTELWQSDGTVAGTSLVRDFVSNGSSSATLFGTYNNRALIEYQSDDGTPQLVSYATNGTFELLAQGTIGDFGLLGINTDIPGHLIVATHSVLGNAPSAFFDSDGTAAGTMAINNPNNLQVDVREGKFWNGKLYFAITSGNYGIATYDPITRTLEQFTGSGFGYAFEFTVTDQGLLWSENSPVVNKFQLRYLNPALTLSTVTDGAETLWGRAPILATVNNHAIFAGVNNLGSALRRFDGPTVTNLTTLALAPTLDAFDVTPSVQVNGLQYFMVKSSSGYRLWRTDGSADGTIALTDQSFGFESVQMAVVGQQVFVVGNSPQARQLWVTDGTVAGTVLVMQLGFAPEWITSFAGKLVIANQSRLWVSDGTTNGTYVQRLLNSVIDFPTTSPVVFQGALYFSGTVFGTSALYRLTGSQLDGGSFLAGDDANLIAATADDRRIAYLLSENGTTSLWTTTDGFQSRSSIDRGSVGDIALVSGVLYYTKSTLIGTQIYRSDLGLSKPVLIGSFSRSFPVILRSVDDTLYVFGVKNDVRYVYSNTGPEGTLEIASDLAGFRSSNGSWYFDDLNGTAIGPAPFDAYGIEIGTTNPTSRVTLANQTIQENLPVGTTVGSLYTSWTNPARLPVQFSLVSGPGSDSNSLFAIDNNGALLTNQSLDADAQDIHRVRIRATFANGSTVENSCVIFVQNVSDTIESVDITNSLVAENSPAGLVVGTLSSPPVFPGDVYGFELVSANGQTSNLPFRISGASLIVNGPLDYEATQHFDLRIRITDSVGTVVIKTLGIDLIDVNENSAAPIKISSDSILENNPQYALVGSLSTPSLSGNVTYVLDTTWDANSPFAIDGNRLLLRDSADYEAGDGYNVSIVATNGSTTLTSHLTIAILPMDEFSPTEIQLFQDGNQINRPVFYENTPIGTHVYQLRVVDRDRGEQYSFTAQFANAITTVGSDIVMTSDLDFENPPPNDGTLRITATNAFGASIFVTKTSVVIFDRNDAPLPNVPIEPQQFVPNDLQASFTVPSFAFSDQDGSDVLTLTARLASGPLPSWLTFDSPSQTFRSTATPANAGVYTVVVTATDLAGASASTNFALTITNGTFIRIQATAANDNFVVSPFATNGRIVTRNGAVVFQGTVTAADLISIDGLANNDTLIINGDATANQFIVRDSDVSIDGIIVRSTNAPSRELRGLAGNDTFTVKTTAAGAANRGLVRGTTTIVAGTGTDTLVGPDLVNNAWSIIGANAGTLNGVAFNDVENLVGGNRIDAIEMASGGSISGSINGKGGVDTLNYAARNTPINVQLTGIGVGNATSIGAFASIETIGTAARATNTIESIVSSGSEWLLQSGNQVATLGVSLIGFGRIVGSNGPDRFVLSDPSANYGLDGRGGIDRIDYTDTSSPPTVNAQQRTGTGFSRVDNIESYEAASKLGTYTGQNVNTLWTITPEAVRLSDGTELVGFYQLIGGSANDTFTYNPSIESNGRAVYGRGGIDTIRSLGSSASWGLVDVGVGGIGPLSFGEIENLEARADVNFIGLYGAPTSAWFRSLSGNGTGTTLFYNTSLSVIVNLATRVATGFLQFDNIGSVQGSNVGQDKVIGANVDTTWTGSPLTGFSNGTVSFLSFESIVGGSGNDWFEWVEYQPNVTVPSSLDGGLGINTLSFVFAQAGVTVNLETGRVDSRQLAIANIRNVVGSPYDDVLIGNAQNNFLRGLGGNDQLFGRAGDDILLGDFGNDYLEGGSGDDILIGGLGADTLRGGLGDDLLVSGEVSFLYNQSLLDIDQPTLALLASEWTSNRNYDTKVQRLTQGVGPNRRVRFAGDTVTFDGSTDILFGEEGTDWFVTQTGDQTPDLDVRRERRRIF